MSDTNTLFTTASKNGNGTECTTVQPTVLHCHWGNNKDNTDGLQVPWCGLLFHLYRVLPKTKDFNATTLIARLMGPTFGPSGPTGPSWVPCWPHELCYLGMPGYAHFWMILFFPDYGSKPRVEARTPRHPSVSSPITTKSQEDKMNLIMSTKWQLFIFLST